jgi:TetR/AcrR family transcriptional regulator, regulator of autoinduction and epiphytic fitness
MSPTTMRTLLSIESHSIQIERYYIDMADAVNPARPSLRAERAAVTRRRIADGARRLFVRDGYGATTLQAVADEAGVAVQTVYAVYGSKAGILRGLRDAVVHQPEAEALAREAFAAVDAGEALDRFARSIRARWDAGSEVVRIYAEAASTDPVLRAEHEAVYARRRGGLRHLAETLEDRLAAGIDAARATAILDALTLPELYAELVAVQGWTSDAYEAWLAATLRQQLLGR